MAPRARSMARRLEHLREREEKDDRCAFGPLAQHDRAGDRHQHQDVDVEHSRTKREPGAAARCECRPGRWRSRAAATTTTRPRDTSSAIRPATSATPEPQTRRGAARSRRRPGAASSCSSHARMPVCATASAMRDVGSWAASCLTRSRCPRTSASSDSSPARRFRRALEDRYFLVAVHPFHPEDRFGVQLTNGTVRAHRPAGSSTCVDASVSSWTMCWSSSE